MAGFFDALGPIVVWSMVAVESVNRKAARLMIRDAVRSRTEWGLVLRRFGFALGSWPVMLRVNIAILLTKTVDQKGIGCYGYFS